MGAYTRAGVDHYIGSYLTIRPSFTVADGIMAYRTDISWEDDWPSLVFQERDRPDKPFLHRGRLYIPASSMYIHLVSLTKGAMRMVMLSQLDPSGQMRGLVTTLAKQRAQLVPVSAPIVYLKRDDFSAGLGEIGADDASHREYSLLLAGDDRAGLCPARCHALNGPSVESRKCHHLRGGLHHGICEAEPH